VPSIPPYSLPPDDFVRADCSICLNVFVRHILTTSTNCICLQAAISRGEWYTVSPCRIDLFLVRATCSGAVEKGLDLAQKLVEYGLKRRYVVCQLSPALDCCYEFMIFTLAIRRNGCPVPTLSVSSLYQLAYPPAIRPYFMVTISYVSYS
jgi:hypothetical protein